MIDDNTTAELLSMQEGSKTTSNSSSISITFSEEEFAKKKLISIGYIKIIPEPNNYSAFDTHPGLVVSKNVIFTRDGIKVLAKALHETLLKEEEGEKKGEKMGGLTPLQIIYHSTQTLATQSNQFFNNSLSNKQINILGKYLYLLLRQKRMIKPLVERIGRMI